MRASVIVSDPHGASMESVLIVIHLIIVVALAGVVAVGELQDEGRAIGKFQICNGRILGHRRAR